MHCIGTVLISDETWETHFDCDLSACKGACCRYGDRGCPIDEIEEARIKTLLPHILPWLPPSHQRFLEAGIGETYRGELHIREIAKDHPCPLGLIDSDGILLCTLHRFSLENNLPLIGTKPLWCSLFPIMIRKSATNWLINSAIQPHCASVSNAPPLILAFRQVLEPIFGKAWIQAVRDQYVAEGAWVPDDNARHS